MVAAGRIRFCPLILLIVVLNVVASRNVVERGVNANGCDSIVTNGSSPTVCFEPESSTSSINVNPKEGVTDSGAETDSTDDPDILLNSPVAFTTDTSTGYGSSESNDDTTSKWCLMLTSESDGIDPATESNEINSHMSEEFPKLELYSLISETGSTCGIFRLSSQNKTDDDVLYVTVSRPSKLETQLCVDFVRDYDNYVDKVSIIGDGFQSKVGKPGQIEVISGLKRCCPCKYTVVVRCKTGEVLNQVIETEKQRFPVNIVRISPDVIYWSYPVEGLLCIKEFRIDLNVVTNNPHGNTIYVVTNDQDTGGNFKLTLLDPWIICFSKNVTITPVFNDFSEGISVTEQSEVDLSINPYLEHSSVNVIQYNWNVSELLSKCVEEIRVFDGNSTTAITKSSKNLIPSRATLKNPDVCRLYTFTFEVIDLDGTSRSQVVRNTSVLDVAEDSVVDLRLIENVSQFAWIEWSPPSGMAYCIKSYLVEEQYYDMRIRQEFNSSSHMLVEHEPFTNETIRFRLNTTELCSLASISVSPISLNGSRWMISTLHLPSMDPVENLHIHSLSSSAINITWDAPQHSTDCVEYYLVYTQEFPNSAWNSTSSSITIDNLIPCINYTFVVVPVNRYGLNHSSSTASISMPEERIPQVQEVMSHDDEIEWSLPSQSISCLKEFQVILKTTDNRLIVNTTISKKSKARELEPNTYRFRKTSDIRCAVVKYSIIPVSQSGQQGSPYEIIITPRPKPGPVVFVTISTNVEREVTISWMPPALFPECVSSYLISYEDRNVSIPANETSVTIQNLNSCVEYNFTIATVDFSGQESASVIVNATVKEEKLSGVQDLELTELDPRSLIARWKPPANGTFCVASYRYVAWITGAGDLPEPISDSTTDMHVTFVEVSACTKYNVQVIPVSKGFNDGNNEIADILTKERVILRYHIDPVRIKNQMAQSLELQTALTADNNNNCDLHAVRFTCTTNNVPEGEDPKVITGEAEISDLNATFSAVVTPLQPYNEYNCTAAILNIAGWSDETALAPFMTGEDFPEQPQNLQLRGDFRMIELTWQAPKVKNGIISRYRVHIRSEGARYPTPSYCPLPDPYNSTFDLHEDDENTRLKNWDNDELDHKIEFLKPYTDYVVQVAAATKAGLGPYTEMVSVATLPEQPEPVYEFSDFNVTLPEIEKPYNSTVHISWKIPCNLYGRLRSFAGQFIGTKGAFEHTFGWTKTIGPSEDILETYSLMEDRLEPELQYNVSIIVFVEDVANHSDPKFLTFLSPAGIPNITNEINWGTVNVMDAPNPTRSARILISDIIFQSNVGSITNVALLVSERHCQADPVPKRNISLEWPEVLSWRAATQRTCIPQYQTTPKQWNPVENRRLGGRQTPEIEYIIGKDLCEDDQEYCNGALRPGTEYALIVRIFTNSGYSDSAIQFFQTDSLIRLTVIVSSIFVCLLAAFALGLVILWRTQKLTVSPLMAVRSPNEEPADIPLKSFSGIYEELIQSNREKINKEYQAINFFSEQLISEKVTFFVAKENERKNRYLGIFPYDGNRVPLDVDDILVEEDEESNDYINASFIDGYKYQREYIATQGPKKETCYDFWRMILQYEVESIVMLTQTVENDRIKCYQYFPRFNQTVHFREVSVKCTQELNMGFYQKRLFVVTKDSMSKAVFHYHFLTWPDHGCPSSALDLIKFIKIIRSERKNLALPVVVHCSAGVGRTGTLIALDIILQRIQQEKKINIYDTVKQLRTQRVKMVQTSEQYAFLYHACLEYTTRNNRKKPKTSTEEISMSARSSPDSPSSVAPKNGRRPMINIKFPKYVHSGISNVKSYVPDDVESKT